MVINNARNSISRIAYFQMKNDWRSFNEDLARWQKSDSGLPTGFLTDVGYDNFLLTKRADEIDVEVTSKGGTSWSVTIKNPDTKLDMAESLTRAFSEALINYANATQADEKSKSSTEDLKHQSLIALEEIDLRRIAAAEGLKLGRVVSTGDLHSNIERRLSRTTFTVPVLDIELPNILASIGAMLVLLLLCVLLYARTKVLYDFRSQIVPFTEPWLILDAQGKLKLAAYLWLALIFSTPFLVMVFSLIALSNQIKQPSMFIYLSVFSIGVLSCIVSFKTCKLLCRIRAANPAMPNCG